MCGGLAFFCFLSWLGWKKSAGAFVRFSILFLPD